ncbi:1-deoxy-D-xylulose-5-phosphate reductoisomerase [bacterium]|nr:1-deoxy-D-xylulose-5-phosphate reductoisomerase [bacterium]
MPKKVCLLGATGSIGVNCLKVIAALEGQFEVVSMAARRNVKALLEAARAAGVRRVCVSDPEALRGVPPGSLAGFELHTGDAALVDFAADSQADIVVNALVGAAGLPPSVAALKAGKRLALANKESLVMAGAHLMRLAAETPGAGIVPVDSEHSAIFQLLESHGQALERIVITASGGPFRGCTREELERKTYSDALRHPTWSMGPKITVDSASLANKGLEVIEAHFLFGLGYEAIDVLVHPQSIVHGMSVYGDGAVLAHMGVPDMRIPIQYALTWPTRQCGPLAKPDFPALGCLTFERVDSRNFPCLELAYAAGRQGGVATAVFNAANEAAVSAFSRGAIGFMDIPRLIEKTLAAAPGTSEPSLETILEADRWAREYAASL